MSDGDAATHGSDADDIGLPELRQDREAPRRGSGSVRPRRRPPSPTAGSALGDAGSGRARARGRPRHRRKPHRGRAHRRGSDRQGRRLGRRTAPPPPRGSGHRDRRRRNRAAHRRAGRRRRRLRVAELGATTPTNCPTWMPSTARGCSAMPTSSRPRCCRGDGRAPTPPLSTNPTAADEVDDDAPKRTRAARRAAGWSAAWSSPPSRRRHWP